MNAASPSPWWDKARFADRRPFLMARGRIRAAFRAFFEEAGFTEVETGILQRSPGNETHLHAFATTRVRLDGARERLYLHTSPEFAAKKLIAAGETRIVDFARVFRNREAGPLHANEFTMIEWYRVGEDYSALMADCAALLALAARAAGEDMLKWRGSVCNPALPPERIPVAEAFRRHAGIDLLSTLDGAQPNRAALAKAAESAGIQIASDDTWSDIFSRVLVEKVEPHLGQGRATILDEYPIPEAALARGKPGDPRVAQRFELYACGVELANAFSELTDPAEQRRRFERDMAEKESRYGERYPIDEELLKALAIMPETSGIALGFDRLVVLATGAPDITSVQWTPPPEGTLLP